LEKGKAAEKKEERGEGSSSPSPSSATLATPRFEALSDSHRLN